MSKPSNGMSQKNIVITLPFTTAQRLNCVDGSNVTRTIVARKRCGAQGLMKGTKTVNKAPTLPRDRGN